MTNSSKEHRTSNNSVKSKAPTCYICDKTIKDNRLTSHLLFGSLQCKDCDHKFRRCRDFDTFQKNADKKEVNGSCTHQALRWTRDPAEYLERKLEKDIERLKSGHHRPSTREVVKRLLSYVSCLEPIENKSPWRRAIRKIKKLISSKDGISKGHDRGEGKHQQDRHHYGKDKRPNNDVSYSSKRKSSLDKGKEHKRCDSQENLDRDINCHIFNDNNNEKSKNDNEFQSTNSCCNECIVPQYTEEVIIPHTEWEIDDQSFSEFHEINKSVAISLGNEFNDKISFTVEEIHTTKDKDMGPVSLIIDNINSHEEIAHEIPTALEGSIISSKKFCETSKWQSMHSHMGVTSTESEDLDTEIDRTTDTNKDDKKNGEMDEEELGPIAENKRMNNFQLCNEANFPVEYENTNITRNEIDYINQLCNKNDESIDMPLNHRKLNPLHKDTKFDKVLRDCRAKNQNKKTCSRIDSQRRISSRMDIDLHEDSESESDDKFSRCSRSNSKANRSSKYNLRRRRDNSIDSFLQQLNATEKKKLWEKLVPTARKLRKMICKNNGVSPPTFIVPFDSEDSDDDYLVDVLLSQVLETEQPCTEANFSAEEDEVMNYRNADEITLLLNQVRRIVKQFFCSTGKSSFSAADNLANSPGNSFLKSDSEDTNYNIERKAKKKAKTECTYRTKSKDNQTKTFYISPPSDGNYYVVNYPSQPLITECPMCYFRVFPSMFSLNLVTNLATTKCVGCMLTIYVVQEPSENNSLPKIVFRQNSSKDCQITAKPARFKNNTPKRHTKVNARTFFKN